MRNKSHTISSSIIIVFLPLKVCARARRAVRSARLCYRLIGVGCRRSFMNVKRGGGVSSFPPPSLIIMRIIMCFIAVPQFVDSI